MHRLLAHIFDKSACLTKRQLRDYVNGVMSHEECYTIERHANDCTLCSDAIEGLSLHKSKGIEQLNMLSSDFINEHFQNNLPPAQLNSFVIPPKGARKSVISLLTLGASLVVAAIAFYLIELNKTSFLNRQSNIITTTDSTSSLAVEYPEGARHIILNQASKTTENQTTEPASEHFSAHSNDPTGLMTSADSDLSESMLTDQSDFALPSSESESMKTPVHAEQVKDKAVGDHVAEELQLMQAHISDAGADSQ